MAVDRGTLNAGLMAQIAEARARADAAEAARDGVQRQRAAREEAGGRFKVAADTYTGEADSWQAKAKARQEEAGKLEGEYNKALTDRGYYSSRQAELKNLNQNLDAQTAAKIGELEASGNAYSSPTPTGGSSFAPPSAFGDVQTTFGGLRDKVRQGFEARAMMDRDNAGDVLDRNRMFNRRAV